MLVDLSDIVYPGDSGWHEWYYKSIKDGFRLLDRPDSLPTQGGLGHEPNFVTCFAENRQMPQSFSNLMRRHEVWTSSQRNFSVVSRPFAASSANTLKGGCLNWRDSALGISAESGRLCTRQKRAT